MSRLAPMSRVAAAAAATAIVVLPAPAWADNEKPTTSILGAQFGGSGGIFAAPHQQDQLNVVLDRAGWRTVPPVAGWFQIQFGLTVLDLSLDLHFAGSDATDQGGAGYAGGQEYHRGSIGADLGYRMRLGSVLTVTPFMSASSLRSTLCFAGSPSSSSPTGLPAFEQFLANPGRKTCLEASAFGFSVGFAFAANLRFNGESDPKVGWMGSYLSFGPRIAYTLAIPRTRTWETGPSSDLAAEVPAFEGPIAPLGGLYAGLELQLRFALENPSAR